MTKPLRARTVACPGHPATLLSQGVEEPEQKTRMAPVGITSIGLRWTVPRPSLMALQLNRRILCCFPIPANTHGLDPAVLHLGSLKLYKTFVKLVSVSKTTAPTTRQRQARGTLPKLAVLERGSLANSAVLPGTGILPKKGANSELSDFYCSFEDRVPSQTGTKSDAPKTYANHANTGTNAVSTPLFPLPGRRPTRPHHWTNPEQLVESAFPHFGQFGINRWAETSKAGMFLAELNEFLTRQLVANGYSGVEVRVTPTRTEIIIMATCTFSS
ncbi:ribosomal protein S3 [Culex quinquefasciatus]|uniref:Ribosomal protein S3 n=1 Tax=Culex quinquefasciatus TaxID=7176 RepID=B0X9G2_CULQU|nr:ribosomal protein S3 [Culex quinquefasciatus]|eukprot:XP_001866283.1 ribosomal protein S3 [Culex quinquefasciatus]